MKLNNRAICTKCGDVIISTMGGEFVKCKCGASFIDTDRWDCMRVRLGGCAKEDFDLNTAIMWILLKMCVAVNAPFYKINPKKEGWFLKYSWTSQQQEDFIKWLANEFYTNKRLRQFFFMYPKLSHTKKACLEGARSFVFNYGWKTI